MTIRSALYGALRIGNGALVIDNDTGATTAELGDLIPGLATVADAATAAVHGGYVEPWRWALMFIEGYAVGQGIEVELVDKPDDWPPLEPGCVGAAASAVEPCPCACNEGGWCGGCGHAGCGALR